MKRSIRQWRIFLALAALGGCGVPVFPQAGQTGIYDYAEEATAPAAATDIAGTSYAASIDNTFAAAPLQVTGVEPAPAADAVPLDQMFVVWLNRPPASSETLMLEMIWLEKVDLPDGDAVERVPVAWEIRGDHAIGKALLEPDRTYRWRFPDALAADALQGAFVRTSFAGTADPPHLLAVSPPDGANAVPPSAEIRMTFNRPVSEPALSLQCNGAATQVPHLYPLRSGMVWQSLPGFVWPPLADCVVEVPAFGRRFQFTTRVALHGVRLLAVNVDPQADWSCSDGSCTPFCGGPGDGTVSTSDEYITIVNGLDQPLPLSRIRLELRDTTPESWYPEATDACFSQGGAGVRALPGEIVVLGNPPGSMNNESGVYLYLDDELTDWVEIQDGPGVSGDHVFRAPGGGAAAADAEEVHRRYLPDGTSYWEMVTAAPGKW